MKIVAITPTGDRPDSLNRQVRYLQRTFLPPETEPHWIVIDDGTSPYCPDTPDGWDTIYFLRQTKEERASIVANLLLGLAHARTLEPDFVFFWEDDDWYGYNRIYLQLEAMKSGIKMHGYANSLYYHVPSQKYRIMPNKTASLFEMAITRSLLNPVFDFLQQYRGDGLGLDGRLWREFGEQKTAQARQEYRSIGLKGLPGRGGIGCGHKPRGKKWRQDERFQYLTSLIGRKDVEDILGE